MSLFLAKKRNSLPRCCLSVPHVSLYGFQKRTVKKSQEAKAKPKKDSDIVRERIIRRAALEFEDGMYGILL